MTLTDEITRDLSARLGAGIRAGIGAGANPDGDSPIRLTLASLAAHYQVSQTPIRQALQRLMDQGIVERLPNGRLASARPARTARRRSTAKAQRSQRAASTDTAATAASSLTASVERAVLHRSMRGDHRFLREEAFAEELGVGRARLRRILHEMAGAGVVQHVERRGWRARPFEHQDMLAFLDVRTTLEQQAFDLARSRFEDAQLARFLAGNDRSAVANRTIDNGLHRYFVDKADNHYLAAFFASHGRYYARLFDFATIDTNRIEEMAGQHTEILQHARARRWARARSALRHHIHSQAPVLGAAIDRLKQDPAAQPGAAPQTHD